MSAGVAQRRLTAELAEKLKEAGFKKRGAFLVLRDRGERVEQISCSVRKDRTSGFLLATLTIMVQFPAINRILGNVYESYNDPNASTIGVPIHFLHADCKYVEWDLGKEDSVQKLHCEVETFGIPFFEKFSTLDAVTANLRSDAPRDWLGLAPERRAAVLAAILVLKGEQADALSFLDGQADPQRTKHPEQRRRLKLLRDKLENYPVN